jgi:hypothetical protein
MDEYYNRVDLSQCSWQGWVKDEFVNRRGNACVGQVLAAESERARVWHLRLPPGERIPFHTHVLDYFWTCLSGGSAKSHVALPGKFEMTEFDLIPGSTRFENFARGTFKTHDLENIGDIELVFVTVEFLQSANTPLPTPQAVRRAADDYTLRRY